MNTGVPSSRILAPQAAGAEAAFLGPELRPAGSEVHHGHPARSDALRVHGVQVRDLERWARETAQQASAHDVVPITAQRARAHSANPYAAADDVGLLLAYENGRCIGYVGIMPGRLRVGRQRERVYWVSTFYVAPDRRRAGVGRQLMSRLLALKYDLVLSAPSVPGEHVFRRLGFCELGQLRYLALRRRPAKSARSQAVRIVGRVGGVLRSLAKLQAPNRRRGRWCLEAAALRVGAWRFRPIACLPPGIAPNTHSAAVAFHRGPEIIAWMLSFPWVAEHRNLAASGYYFSDVREVFRHMLLGAYQADDHVCRGYAALLLSVHNGASTLKMLDCSLPTADPGASLSQLALACAEYLGVTRVELPQHCGLAREIVGAKWSAKEQRRLYLCRPFGPGSPLARLRDRLWLDYCDGEHAFI